MPSKKKILSPFLTYALFVLAIVLIGVNQYLILGYSTAPSKSSSLSGKSISLTGDAVQDATNAIVPTGIPDVYGDELGVSFDEPVKSLDTLAKLDRTISLSSLDEVAKAKYIEASKQISCEFCCGAQSVISPDGRAACGCSHSAAIRGLGLYLAKSHPDFTSDDILRETTKWKVLFFPGGMIKKAVAAMQAGLELSPTVLNDLTLLQKIDSKDLSSIGELPQMVGGC